MTGGALVTGADEPVGGAIAHWLGVAGWRVALHHGGNPAAAASLAEAIVAEGGFAATLAADLAREDEVAALLPRATQAVGGLSLLVNAATVCAGDLALTATRSSWDRHMETNLRAPFVLMQQFAQALPRRADGVIINILERGGAPLSADFVSFTAARAGGLALTRAMALALGRDRGIRVNAIEPGARIADLAAAVRFILATPSLTGQTIALERAPQPGWAPPGGDRFSGGNPRAGEAATGGKP